MKSLKTILCGALALLAAAMASQAQTHVYLNGSTAFRAGAVAAIKALFDGQNSTVTTGTLYEGYQGSAEQGSHAHIFSGTIGGVPYIIKASWTGSESGLQCTGIDSTGVKINFIQDTPYKSGTPVSLTTGAQSGSNGAITYTLTGLDDPTSSVTTQSASFDYQYPDAAFSDTYQATSQFFSGATLTYADNSTHTMPTLTPANTGTNGTQLGDGIIGIAPFIWAADKHSVGVFSNIDDATIKFLEKSSLHGYFPRAFLSGSASDTVRVYSVGRNPDSGTRLTAFAQSGVGALTSIRNYKPVLSTGATVTAAGSTIASIVAWPVDTVNFIKVNSPNSGYSSGGQLAGAVGSETSGMVGPGNVVGGDIVAYLAYSDFLSGTSGGATALTYNGAPFSYAGIENGQYKFWSYEHIYLNPNTTNSALVNSLATAIHDGVPAVLTAGQAGAGFQITDVIGNMVVGRSGTVKDGQPVSYSGF